MKMQRRRKRGGGWGRNREKKKMGWRRKREERRDSWEERDGERWGFEGAVVGGGWKERRAGRVGNKREVAWDASILQRGRYVGIASRGSLSRTANYGIMHTAGPVPQL